MGVYAVTGSASGMGLQVVQKLRDAGQLADWVIFMLSDAADFLCGSVLFVDGGSDAYFRADDWPRPVPPCRLVSYLRRFRGFSG